MSLKFASTISVVYINKILSRSILFFLILIGAFVIRVYKIKEAFPFDHDQEIPANAAYDFFILHKVTLIGQELSFPGVFLGPLHSWIQFIPYGACNLLPDCVPYLYISFGVITVILLYLVTKNIFDHKTATIATILYAFSFAAILYEWGVNSNYFLFLTSIGLLFSLHKYFLGKDNYLIFGSFIAGMATVNFNPVFIFSTIAFWLSASLRIKRRILIFFLAIIAFFINYATLIIFNFRHDNILFNNLKNFANQNATAVDLFGRSRFFLRDVLIPYYSDFLFQKATLIFIIITLLLISFGFVKILKTKDKFLLFLPIWILIVFLGFLFYRGWVPNYYFQQTLLPMILLVSFAIRKNYVIFLVFIVIFLSININKAIKYDASINYQYKKRVINYVINDTKEATFNVYYDMPPGINTGYSYIFKAFGREPQEGGQNLYILEFVDPTQFREDKYQITYPHKEIFTKAIGFVHIVSVK